MRIFDRKRQALKQSRTVMADRREFVVPGEMEELTTDDGTCR
jgi:hypothetical protein